MVGWAEECSPEESGCALCDANSVECKSLYSCALESSIGHSEGINGMPEQSLLMGTRRESFRVRGRVC